MKICSPFADQTDHQQYIQFLLKGHFVHRNIKILLNFTVIYVTVALITYQITALACPVTTVITHTSSSQCTDEKSFLRSTP